jgi:hypothetical protein
LRVGYVGGGVERGAGRLDLLEVGMGVALDLLLPVGGLFGCHFVCPFASDYCDNGLLMLTHCWVEVWGM